MKRRAAFMLLVFFAVVAITSLAFAQGKAAPGRRHHPTKPKGADAGAGSASEMSAPSARGEPDSRPVDAGTIESKTLDGGTRVFRFGEVEVEGRLRNPQLVYFLRRVRAEFAAGDLGHRSFMRELSDTRHDPSF